MPGKLVNGISLIVNGFIKKTMNHKLLTIYKPKLSLGFTLIELLVVIAILGTLTASIVLTTNNARDKGKDARRKDDLKAVSSALVAYYADHGEYPAEDDPSLVLDYSSDVNPDGWIPDMDEYLPKFPKDPLQAGLTRFIANIFNSGNGDVASAKDIQNTVITGRLLSLDRNTGQLELLDYSEGTIKKLTINGSTTLTRWENNDLNSLKPDFMLEVRLVPGSGNIAGQISVIGLP